MTAVLPVADPRRARAAVSLLFLLLGVSVGGWLSRVPDVKGRLQLDDAAWGATVVASTVGSLVAVATVAALVTRTGPRLLVRVAAPALLVVTPLLALAPGRGWLVAGLVLFGMSTSALNTPMNAQAVVAERAAARPLMGSFHACYSLGTLAGALLGAACAALGVAPAAQLFATSALLGAALLATGGGQPGDPPRVPPVAGPRRRPTGPLLLLAVVALCAALAEGVTSQWAAIYVDEDLRGPAGLGAVAYGCFAATMTLGRLVGDRAVLRLGRGPFLRASGAVAALGLLLGLGLGSPLGACLGFALLGAGLSCVIPTVYGAAGNQPGVAAGAGVAAVSVASWPAFLVGPPLVGWLSGQTGLRWALLVVVAGAAVVAVLGGRVRGAEPAS